MGYRYIATLYFKTKSIKSKAIFLRTFFLKVQAIKLVRKDTEVVGQLTETAIFIVTPTKTYLAVHFIKMHFLSIY